ncbi:MAG TPA: translation initiation factor IF-2 subunit gamma [Candidatus Nanoarchaeia archaeon]|nr:translation initiation factor IF-2 subunit gamma [Candidatus Nanoarchaeia archaeon]
MVKKASLGQPEVNIGLAGHVDNGKTTLTAALSGKWTDTHSEEIKRGITIKLGYADAVFYKCKKGHYGTSVKCLECKGEATALRKVSFVDAPGHESLMATMLSGAAIMDGALLLVAANEECPQPQTKEHLIALKIIGIKNIVIVQNKIDLVTEEQALKNYKQIKDFVKGTIAENAPIIPISAQHKINVDALIKAIENVIKTPKRDSSKEPLMFVARSFDINRPGAEIEKLNGGVLGGSLKQGILKIKDKIEIKPGRGIEKEGKKIWEPIKTEILSIKTGEENVKEAGPGGSIGVLTKLDPYYVKADSLVGNIAGHVGKLPPVFYELNMKPELLERVVGSKEDLVVEQIKKGEPLMLNVNSAVTVGIVFELKKDIICTKLKIPVCCNKEDRVAISRRFGTRWRLIGMGNIV